MKYGMPTLLEFNTINENVKFAKKHNLDFIELNMNLPICLNIKDKELMKYDIEFTMHISEELNIGELNNNLWKSYIKEIKRQINFGIKNNIKKYTIHLNQGIYFTMSDGKKYLTDKYERIYLNNIIKSLNILNEIAKNNNIFINFENTKINSSISKAINLINKYDNLGFTFDIGHNEKNDNKAYPLMKNKIRHIHIHDYDGKKDHLPIGNGIIDFKKYEKKFNECYIIIEVKEVNNLINSINLLKNRLLSSISYC